MRASAYSLAKIGVEPDSELHIARLTKNALILTWPAGPFEASASALNWTSPNDGARHWSQ
jgi:hypothetical protein